MKRPSSSIDGFVPRRADARLGDNHRSLNRPGDRPLHTSAQTARQTVGSPQPSRTIGRSDIDESLRSIDTAQPETTKKSRRRQKKSHRHTPNARRRHPLAKFLMIVVAIALLIAGGYFFYKVVLNSGRIFSGNFFDLVQSQPLKKDVNGRSNFLVFGTAEDSEGGTHEGGQLTDSIMVISVDQENKDAYMISLPRDLWVEYDEPCSVGLQGKLNAVYYCASDDGEQDMAGAMALQSKAGEILGLDIQYYVHLNFSAVIDAVDAVGGVEVTIESDDPRGILDRNFDWRCNYQCYYVNYKNGETVQLDGEHALALARARNASGGYGLLNGNFDREKNQQKIIAALRKKAISAGTLTNLGAVTSLMDAMGNNLRSNIETKEIRTLMGLATDITDDKLRSVSLVEEDEMMVVTGMYNGQSIVRPVAGLLNYSEIRAYVKRIVNASPVSQEQARVSVYNGGRVAGSAATEADKLEDIGFIVDQISNAPEDDYEIAEIYVINDAKTASLSKLEQTYGVTAKHTTPPVSVMGETDFVVVLGPR